MPRARSIPHRRLAAQQITRPAATPAEAVAWLGAVQAQDYLASLWAVGLRTRTSRRAAAAPATPESAIERAIADSSIVRTHAFRGTLQLIARDDVRWMLALVGGRVIRAIAGQYRRLDLDEPTMLRAEDAFRATTQGAQRTRAELAVALERARIDPGGQRLLHIIARAELDAVICSGARRGKHATFAAFDERVPAAPARPRDQALAELTRRYLQSRGPATLRDFMWWSGLPAADARAGIAAIEGELAREDLDGVIYWSLRTAHRGSPAPGAILVPAFDEYLVGYQDRRDVLHPDHVRAINAGGGLLAPCVLVDGHVIGTWRRQLQRTAVTVELMPLHRWNRRTRTQVGEAVERYATFLGLPLA